MCSDAGDDPQTIDFHKVVNRFIEELKKKSDDAVSAYAKKPRKRWTELATQALVQAGHALFGLHLEHASRTTKSSWGRSEHLTVDAMVYEKGRGPIRFIAEHENAPSLDPLKTQCWKLAHIRADVRVLVGYYRRPRRRPSSDSCRDFDTGKAQLHKVAERVHSGPIILILGDLDAKSKKPEDFETIYRAAQIGVVNP